MGFFEGMSAAFALLVIGILIILGVMMILAPLKLWSIDKTLKEIRDELKKRPLD